jgi:hypothetical protein
VAHGRGQRDNRRIVAVHQQPARRPRPLAVVLAAAIVLLPGSALAGGGEVTIKILVAGNGTVTTTSGGTTFTCTQASGADGCTPSFPRGTSIRLDAQPGSDPGRTFAGWSLADCPGTGACTVPVDEGLTVIARFPPFRLVVLQDPPGAGTVTRTPAGTPCADPDECTATYGAGAEVVLTATGAPAQWGADSWCRADGASCRATIDFDPFYVGVGWNGVPPPSVPFDVEASVTVSVSGNGTVTGPGLSCPGDCTSDSIDYKQPVVLTARETAGSHFERWVGVCATAERCEFRSGAITRVRALFVPDAPPPTPPPQPPPPPQEPPPLAARITRVSVSTGATRVVAANVVVNQGATVRFRLLRGKATLAERGYLVAAGGSTLRLPVPRRVAPGWSKIALVVRSTRETLALPQRPIRIPARRG